MPSGRPGKRALPMATDVAVHRDAVMPWQGSRKFTYSLMEIAQYAPFQSGVYAVYSGDQWVYIGASVDVGASLRRHLHGDNPCIRHHRPTHFAFELVPARARVSRQQALVREFNPVCD